MNWGESSIHVKNHYFRLTAYIIKKIILYYTYDVYIIKKIYVLSFEIYIKNYEYNTMMMKLSLSRCLSVRLT